MCACQCGRPTKSKRKYISGHNLQTAKINRREDGKVAAINKRGPMIQYEQDNNIVPRAPKWEK